MKQYPSIIGYNQAPKNVDCIAFYKYDGSNLRFEWNHKQGWYKFGTRTQLFDANNSTYGEGIRYFQEKMGDPVIAKLKDYLGKNFRNTRSFIVFGEFLGDSSFSGAHVAHEPKRVILFDVWVFQKGFIEPKEFKVLFSYEPYGAKCVYEGKLNTTFISAVQSNTLSTPLNEGVICKWKNPGKPNSEQSNVFMTKIKTIEFLDRLKILYGNDWEKYA